MDRPVSRVFRPYARWIVAHRLVVVAAILVVTGFFVSRLGSLQVDSNPDLWAPQNHPYVETTNQLEELFGGRNLTVIGVVPKTGDIYQPKVLEKIKRIQDQLELLPHAVRHNILSLAARKVKEVKGGPEGMEVRPMMETVPRTVEEIARLKAAVASMPIYINALVSPDGKAATVVADFKQDERSPNFIALNQDLHRDRGCRARRGRGHLSRRHHDDRRGGRPAVPEDADLLRRRARDHPAGPVLVVPQRAGHAAADGHRPPQRGVEPRADGAARRAPRSAEHHDAHPGAGGRRRARHPDPEALLRGVRPAARHACCRATPTARRSSSRWCGWAR